MAAGVDGLQLALIIFGLIQRFQTPSNFELDEHYLYPENLGLYACSSIQTKSNFDFAIFKLCPGQLDYSNQNGRPKKKQLEQRKVNSPSKFCFICTILLSGDVHMNPGPIKYPCTNCKKGVRSNQRAIRCDFCDEWTHMKCTTISLSQFNKLSTSDETFYCTKCIDRLPCFTDSFFHNISIRSSDTEFSNTGSSECGT